MAPAGIRGDHDNVMTKMWSPVIAAESSQGRQDGAIKGWSDGW